MNSFYLMLSGVLIGTGIVLPGVSGSVIAILMGIYDYVILLLNNSEETIKNKLFKLFPIVLGLIIGIITFGKILLILYNDFKYEMMYIFIGLILGEIPLLRDKVYREKGEKLDFKYIFASVIFSLFIFLIPEILKFSIDNPFNPVNLFAAGFLYISGKIIPGVSSSLFLMVLGLYEYVLYFFANPLSISLDQIIIFMPFFAGVLIGLILLIKFINYLLNNYFSKTYSVIIGFVIGSIFAIYPGFDFNFRSLISIILMIISFTLVYQMSKKN